jgi:hypothetical protein
MLFSSCDMTAEISVVTSLMWMEYQGIKIATHATPSMFRAMILRTSTSSPAHLESPCDPRAAQAAEALREGFETGLVPACAASGDHPSQMQVIVNPRW